MTNWQQFSHWHQTKPGLMIPAVVELGLAYGCFYWAVDNGRLALYVLMVVLFFASLGNLRKYIGKVYHDARV